MPSTCIARISFLATHANTTHANHAQWPDSNTNDTHRESRVVCLQAAGEGVPVREAALQAVNSRLPQNLELQGISRHKVPEACVAQFLLNKGS